MAGTRDAVGRVRPENTSMWAGNPHADVWTAHNDRFMHISSYKILCVSLFLLVCVITDIKSRLDNSSLVTVEVRLSVCPIIRIVRIFSSLLYSIYNI